MSILDQEDFTQEDIQNLINSKAEESLYVEFKSGKSLALDGGAKKEMAKDVSAFANSDGGLIFYGIDEKEHVASSLSFVDGNTVTKEWVENVLISNIQPRIENLTIIPVRFEGDLCKTVFVIKIPRAKSGWPHMSKDNKYYRRYNFQSVPMEEYEVRRAYNNDGANDVVFSKKIVYTHNAGYNAIYVNCYINIENNGTTVCDRYKVGCWFENIGKATISTTAGTEVTRLHNESKISSSNSIPIFPNEVLKAIEFTIELPNHQYEFETIAKSIKVTLALYSVGDTFEVDYPIQAILEQVAKLELENGGLS